MYNKFAHNKKTLRYLFDWSTFGLAILKSNYFFNFESGTFTNIYYELLLYDL